MTNVFKEPDFPLSRVKPSSRSGWGHRHPYTDKTLTILIINVQIDQRCRLLGFSQDSFIITYH